MNEFDLIRTYLSELSKNVRGAYNLSDDIYYDEKKKLAISIDTYVEKKHFLNFNKPDLIIKKALRSAISDLLCKGFMPKYYLLSLSGNNEHLTKKNLKKIKVSLRSEQKKSKINLVGGDTTSSNKLSITIWVFSFTISNPILRSKAKINDDIYVTKTLGDSFVGLKILKKNIFLNRNLAEYFIKKFFLPDLPFLFSKKLHYFANSSIDISDGLFQDLNHILANSKFSAEISVKNIPVSKNLKIFINNQKKKKIDFISKGDDYQILFTANKNKRSLINKISRQTSTKVTRIGAIKKRSNSNPIKLMNTRSKIVKKLGYIHKF